MSTDLLPPGLFSKLYVDFVIRTHSKMVMFAQWGGMSSFEHGEAVKAGGRRDVEEQRKKLKPPSRHLHLSLSLPEVAPSSSESR